MNPAKRERPGVGTEAFEVHAGEAGTTPSLPPARQYPRRIRLSAGAEAFLVEVAVDLLLDRVGLHDLPPALLEIWSYGYEAGRSSRQPELDRANDDATRYYREMCRRPAAPTPDLTSYAELERRRGNHDHADQVEAATQRRSAAVTA